MTINLSKEQYIEYLENRRKQLQEHMDTFEDNKEKFLKAEEEFLNEYISMNREEITSAEKFITYLENDSKDWIAKQLERIEKTLPSLKDRKAKKGNISMMTNLKRRASKLENSSDEIITEELKRRTDSVKRSEKRLKETEERLKFLKDDPEGYVKERVDYLKKELQKVETELEGLA